MTIIIIKVLKKPRNNAFLYLTVRENYNGEIIIFKGELFFSYSEIFFSYGEIFWKLTLPIF